MIEERTVLAKTVRKVVEEATTEAVGSTFHTIIFFHLQQKFGKDPYEVFMDEPRTFYDGLDEVLGTGANAVIGLIAAFLTKQYGANCTSDELITLLIKGDTPSKRRLSEIFSKACTHTEKIAK